MAWGAPRPRRTCRPSSQAATPASPAPGHPRRRSRPQTIAGWTRQVKAERAAALARDATQTRHQPACRLTEDDIRALITALGDLRDVIRDAEPAEKAATYDQLGLRVTLKPGQDRIRAEVTIRPENYVEQTERYGAMGRVRGGT
jgi:hypothetical protein